MPSSVPTQKIKNQWFLFPAATAVKVLQYNWKLVTLKVEDSQRRGERQLLSWHTFPWSSSKYFNMKSASASVFVDLNILLWISFDLLLDFNAFCIFWWPYWCVEYTRKADIVQSLLTLSPTGYFSAATLDLSTILLCESNISLKIKLQ